MNTKNEEEIQVVRSGACPSLSKASTISYEIGSLGGSQYIRLSGNSAGGLFCRDWVSMADIQQLLSGSAKITSKTLLPVYAGKSANSPGFLLACVLHEKLVENFPAKPPSDPQPQKKPAKKQNPEEER